MPGNLNETICAVVTKNHMAQAKSLAESYFQNHPKGKIFILLVDPVPSLLKSKDPRIKIIPLNQLSKDNPKILEMAFRYEAFELCCALKPFFLEYLLKNYDLQRVLYFDTDILITGKLTSLFEMLSNSAILLTPHLLDHKCNLNDGLHPSEGDILSLGSYNMGFLGVSSDQSARDFLDWWGQRVYVECKKDVLQGYFVDQHWIDLVPGLFSEVKIVRDPGCNVAFWNLHERHIEKNENGYTVNGVPLLFYHFSHYNFWQPNLIFERQVRHSLDHLPAVRELFNAYCQTVLKNGLSVFDQMPYGLSTFDNDVPIPGFVRKMFKKVKGASSGFTDPFATKEENCFFNWLTGNGKQVVPPIVLEMRELRKDVSALFPLPATIHKQIELLKWAIGFGAKEFQLGPIWTKIFALAEVSAKARLKREGEKGFTLRGNLPHSMPYGFGVNLSGHFLSNRNESTFTRASERCLKNSDIPLALNNINDPHPDHRLFHLAHLDFAESNPFNINLMHINPWNLRNFLEKKGPNYFWARHNIGYWVWDMAEFPKQCTRWMEYFDEIWVPSQFLQQSLSAIASIPVVRVPYCLEPVQPPLAASGQKKENLGLGIHEDDFLFFFKFDFFDSSIRKNPEGLIQAFKRAFSNQDKATLVIETINGKNFPGQVAALKKLSTGRKIQITDENSLYKGTKNLAALCDCYVSLHRSEGFGLEILEAMSFGKPVISTSYSGHLDFATSENSFLIPYKDSILKENLGLYQSGSRWVEPIVQAAADSMRGVFENPKLAKQRGDLAARDVNSSYSAKVVENIYQQRLKRYSERQPRSTL